MRVFLNRYFYFVNFYPKFEKQKHFDTFQSILYFEKIFMKSIRLLFIFLFLSFGCSLYAQNKKVLDSLNLAYQTSQEDTSKILTLLEICLQYRYSLADTSVLIAQKALKKSEEINYKRGIATAYNRIGLAYRDRNDYVKAIAIFQKSIDIFEKTHDKKGLSYSVNSMGVAYERQGNYPLALALYQKSLKINEEIKSKKGISVSMHTIGVVYERQGNYPLAIDYFEKSLKINEEIKDILGISVSLGGLGMASEKMGNYTKALAYFERSLKINEELKSERYMSMNMNSLATINSKLGNYALSLEYFEKSLKIAERIKDKVHISLINYSIAQFHLEQKNYDKSIEYAQKGLEIAKQAKALLENKNLCRVLYEAHKGKGDYMKALEYHELYKTNNDSLFSIEKAKSIANLETRSQMERKEQEVEIAKKAQEALEKDNKLQQIEIERQKNAQLVLEKQGEADRLFALAKQEQSKRKQDSLFRLAEKTQLEAEKLKANEKQLEAQNKAQELEVLKEKEAKEFQEKINYFALLGFLSVLLFAYFIFRSRQKERKANNLVLRQKEEMGKQALKLQQINAELAKLSIVASQTNNAVIICDAKGELEWANPAYEKLYGYTFEYFKQTFGSNIFEVVDTETREKIYLAIERKESLIYHFFDTTNHKWMQANLSPIYENTGEISKIVLIDTDIDKLVKAETTLKEKNNALNIAFDEVHKKNKDIRDSINAALRIQNALLPLPFEMENALGKDQFFILFKPRDGVSGDFYWFTEQNKKKILTVADCTGHGVPGSLISMMGMQILDEIVNKEHILEVNLILQHLHFNLVRLLKQKHSQAKEGMDISIISLERNTISLSNGISNFTLEYAGAMNPFYFVQNHEIRDIKADKQPIGASEEERIFQKQTFEIHENTVIYLFTDGFQDQFGGEHNKKFMTKRFRELLFSIHEKPMPEQHQILDETIENWRKQGNEQQIDDITVMGLRIRGDYNS